MSNKLFPLGILGAALGACAPAAHPAANVTARDSAAAVANTAPQAVAPDSVAVRLLADVRSADSTIRVESRYATTNNFAGAVLPGYAAGPGKALLRREAALALARVQARLRPQGLGLQVWDGYRPVRATLAMVDWAERTGQRRLLDDGYIARRSRHNQGVAVDLTLVDLATGRPLEMGTPFDTFSEAAHTANASGEAARNRRTLVDAMAAEGFTNYDQEWWHFSYQVDGPVPFDLVIR
jgi:D-alanyl-D-alanine dipeptidase